MACLRPGAARNEPIRRQAKAPGNQAVRFAISLHAQQVFLLLADENGVALDSPPMQSGLEPDRWELTLQLAPGVYHFRYYARNGELTTYVSPADTTPQSLEMNGLDAVLRVPHPPAGGAAANEIRGTILRVGERSFR